MAETDEQRQAPPSGEDAGRPDTVPEQIREFVGTGLFWAVTVIFVVAASIVAVVIQNTHDVAFRFLWVDIDTPLSAVILVTALIAAAATEAVAAVWRRRRRRVLTERAELRRLREGQHPPTATPPG